MRCGHCRRPIARENSKGRPQHYCGNACRQAAYRTRKSRSIHFQSRTHEWPTPPELFAEIASEFGKFELDVCATAENAKCERFYTIKDDGLASPWTGRCWCNPPYGRTIGLWVAKAFEAAQQGTAELVVCLIPARTDTRWWHEYVVQADEVRFLAGRIRFGNAQSGAPFPSALAVFRNAVSVTKVAVS